MKNEKPQYPSSLFWTGVAVNLLRSVLWLVVSTVLLLLGSTTPWCGWACLSLLALVVAVGVAKELDDRYSLLHMNDPDADDWQAATLSPDWADNVKAMVERAMNDDIELPDDLDEEDEDSHGNESNESKDG